MHPATRLLVERLPVSLAALLALTGLSPHSMQKRERVYRIDMPGHKSGHNTAGQDWEGAFRGFILDKESARMLRFFVFSPMTNIDIAPANV